MPKEFLTYQQQMEKLRSSGLTIEDEGACCRVLADIGYFPVVNGYQSFFRDPSTRVYRKGATFEDILALYKFDVELREIMLDALLKVEAKIRSALAYGPRQADVAFIFDFLYVLYLKHNFCSKYSKGMR